MDVKLEQLRNDLLILTQQILAEAVDEDNGTKLHIGEMFGVLALAIEEDKVESLARTVTKWGNERLSPI